MFTSATKQDIQQARRREIAWTGFICLLCSILCAVFGAVYEYYSHEVYSNYMLYAFLIPLAGGTLPCFTLILSRRILLPQKPAVYLYNSGLASLTVGSLMKGVLEIYGTENALLVIYVIVGFLLVVLGLFHYGAMYFLSIMQKKK